MEQKHMPPETVVIDLKRNRIYHRDTPPGGIPFVHKETAQICAMAYMQKRGWQWTCTWKRSIEVLIYERTETSR